MVYDAGVSGAAATSARLRWTATPDLIPSNGAQAVLAVGHDLLASHMCVGVPRLALGQARRVKVIAANTGLDLTLLEHSMQKAMI